jgi:hypothetical protein
MAVPQQEKVLTALAGEFLVAGKLCLMGYNASLTLKNFPEVDIFAFNPKNKKTISIQVKATNSDGYFIPEKIEEMNIPFVFVYVDKSSSVEYFILSSKDVSKISKKVREDYITSRPNVSKKQPLLLNIRDIRIYKDKWENLGLN